MSTTPTPKDVVKVVPGSAGNGEHCHEEYWVPISPLKLTASDIETGANSSQFLFEPKVLRRKLRKNEWQMLNAARAKSKTKNATVGFNLREHSYQHF